MIKRESTHNANSTITNILHSARKAITKCLNTLETKHIITKSKKVGPIIGSLLGVIPQCGFSVMATNLYITRIITLGTLISIYLSTSDEMLIIMISEKVEISLILKILLIKIFFGIVYGLIIDKIINVRKWREELRKWILY